MKKRNYFAVLGLSVLVLACNDEKKTPENTLSIDSSALKQTYSLEETLPLQLKDIGNMPVDSIVYYLNEVRIGSTKDNTTFQYALNKERFGEKTVKALLYSKGVTSQTSIKINILPADAPEILKFNIVNTYPHDIKAYTQGLEFYNDILIESTGNGEGIGTRKRGKSSIRKVNPKTGEILKIVELPDAIFGEGATVLNNKLYQLTYKNNEAYVYDVTTFEREKTFPYFQNMEGWGLTNDGSYLYMTDGSMSLFKVNPENFTKIDYVTVATNQQAIPNINELEWVNGKIYANIYGMDAICIINPANGAIEGVLDLKELKKKVTQHPDLDVLNGIAYNKKTGTFFVTGKNWDKMFEINITK